MQRTFKWVATFCRIGRPIVLIIDDDVPFSAPFLDEAICQQSLNQGDLLHGIPEKRAKVVRFDKFKSRWWLSKVEMPMPEYPIYTYGVYNLMSFKSLQYLTLGMLFTRPHHIDDAYLGLVAARLGLKFRNIYSILSREHILHDPRNQSELDHPWRINPTT